MLSRLAPPTAGRRPTLVLATFVVLFLPSVVGTGCSSSEPEATPQEPPVAFDKSEFSRKEWAKMREMDREEMLEYKRKLRESRGSAGKPRS